MIHSQIELPPSTPSKITQDSGLILLVDDTEVNRYVLASHLENAGYRVILASNGTEALELAEKLPDLVLLDVNLPDMTGFAVCAHLKARPEHRFMPVILISASFVRGEDHFRGIEGGADSYLTTPLDPLVLISTVKTWMRVRKGELEREKLLSQLRAATEATRLDGLEVERAHRQLSDFFMQAPIPMVILEGPEHLFTLANPHWEKLMVRKPLGRTVLEVFKITEVSHFLPLLDGVYQTGIPYIGKELPLDIPDESGKIQNRLVDIGYHPFRDRSGQIKGIMAIVQDVTFSVQARKKIEMAAIDLATEKYRLEAMISQSPAGIALMRGPDFIFEIVNEKWCELVGKREYLQNNYVQVYPELVGTSPHDSLKQVYETGTPFVAHEMKLAVEIQPGVLADRYYDFSYSRLLDGQGLAYGVICQASNVTARVLDRKLIETTSQSLSLAVYKLEEEKEIRERFVASLTHDLRTPLTAARMSAQILPHKISDLETVKALSSRIVTTIDRADAMIRDLLDANRIKAGESLPLVIEECALKQIATETIEELSLVHGNRFTLEADASCKGYWSRSGVRRILENLCNNAVKYGALDRPVTISLIPDHDQVKVKVHNCGSPISVKDQATLFDLHRRTASATQGIQKGWGLGLTLVEGLTQAHGGKVSVESSSELGTTFCVTLPFSDGSS